jgi:hypothetical protein
MSDTDDLDEIERLAKAATPGEWEPAEWQDANSGDWAAVGPLHAADYDCDGDDGPGCAAHLRAEADAAFIAHLHPARVLALVARLRRAERVVEAARKVSEADERVLDAYRVPVDDEEREQLAAEHAREDALSALRAALSPEPASDD